MKDGIKNGYGIMRYDDDGALYKGTWKDDKHEGHGIKDWGDGIIYEGEWMNGMMHGEGIYTMNDGYVMQGKFEFDEFME